VLISGRLSETTLGDVLGSLARASVTGLIRLTEVSGVTGGRTHGIYLSRGQVIGVESQAMVLPLGEILRQRGLLDGAAHRQLTLRLASGQARERRVGEILVEEKLISSEVVGAALRQQLRAKLDALFRLPDASISFHVACAPPAAHGQPLPPREYLAGRPRARDRVVQTPAKPSRRLAEHRPSASAAREKALRTLGLDEKATMADVTRTFRELATRMHPDRHHDASDDERRKLHQQFAALSAAYHALIGS
jgi:hypothetical protein